MRRPSDEDDVEMAEMRARDMDMAIRLEQKLAEVQARLERKKSNSTGSDGITSSASGDSDSQGDNVAPLFIKKSKSAMDLGRMSMIVGDDDLALMSGGLGRDSGIGGGSDNRKSGFLNQIGIGAVNTFAFGFPIPDAVLPGKPKEGPVQPALKVDSMLDV